MKHYTILKTRPRFLFTIIFISLMIINSMVFVEPSHLWAANRGKISGKIIDVKTKAPLPGVNVVVVGTSLGASTDLEGDFYIANIESGIYNLKVTMMGYKEMTVKNVRVRVNRTTEVNFELEEVVLEGEEIIVYAERPLIEKDVTSSIMILDKQEISARPTTEFNQILTTLPSIDYEDGVMKFRGGTLDEVAFMVDGARVRNPLNLSPYTSFNLSSIREAEVITGSFNAEYGEAVSGVVNIITKEGSDHYELFMDTRYVPPGKRHWGATLYDINTDIYWENSHARHLEWWIENTDQWVDPNGVRGYDARCLWTPEQAYENYLATHQPLTDYTNTPSYQTEVSFGGPVPFLKDLRFFATGKYRSQAPLFGNSFLDKGTFFDGTLKLTYKITPDMKAVFSGFWSQEKTAWGIDPTSDDGWYLNDYVLNSRYAYFDFPGYPTTQTDGQSFIFGHTLNPTTLYEIKLSRVHAKRKIWTLPDDPIGWEAIDATFDNLRAVDSKGNPIIGGYMNRIGYHTTGYYFRYDDHNTDWNITAYLSSQMSKYIQFKTGLEFSYYDLDHYNQAKAPPSRDDRVYNPYQGAFYVQNKLEFSGLIMNIGLRYDFYNPNDVVYTNVFDPFNSPKEKTNTFSQLSPRLGLSHPIDEKTVLHFSYGHFFQRAPYGDYGEGYDEQRGSLTTFMIDGTDIPWVLGNRDLKPQKTVAFEIGIERNFAKYFVLDITGFYKDIRNTIRNISVETAMGIYTTNGNGDYADRRGVEISLRKIPSVTKFGAYWGYANFTTQLGIDGTSGDPDAIREDGTLGYPTSGDVIIHLNPRLKAGFFYRTPQNFNLLKGLFKNITLSVDFHANYPNENLMQDYFYFNGKKYVRPADKNMDLRFRKEINLANDNIKISPYLEVHNLFNTRWISLGTFENASEADQQKFVESDFDYLPSVDKFGVTILELSKFRNLPRSILFGISFEF